MSKYSYQEAINCAQKFAIDGEIVQTEPFGTGHINDTYKVTTNGDSKCNYLLQRINHHVFPNVEGLMMNMSVVLDHLKAKYRENGIYDVEKRTLTIIPTLTGKTYYKDEKGNCWRVFILMENTKSYDIVETAEQAQAGGRAFGEFQKLLADLDAKKLIEVLPNFHNVDFRLENLRTAIERDSESRVKGVQTLLEYIFDREGKMRTVLKMGQAGELPLRITHNDTKFNNVLLDQNDEVQCVIDLDTVMPGYVAYDFGDAIRTIINPAAEDEVDLEKIKLNVPLYAAYAEGYLKEARVFLTGKELESLLYGVFLLPYMQGVRFLTDYLEGDHYYKTKYEEHNLVRAKSQLKLVEELEENEKQLAEILNVNINS